MGFNICVIGCGGMATVAHGPAYAKYASERPDTCLAACCDLDEAKAITYKNTLGFARHYTDLVKMLETEQPDAVCLMAPVELTCELSCRVLELGFPLIMEKPPGMSVEEIDRMIRAARTGGTPTRVAFNRRYAPLIARLRGLLEENPPADIQHIRYDFTRVGRTDADFTTTAIHGVDSVRFLAGSDYKHVRFRYCHFPELGATTANILMDCELVSGATAHLSFLPVAGATTEGALVHLHGRSYHLSLPLWGDFTGFLRLYENDVLALDLSGAELCPSGEKFVVNGFYDENASFFDDLRAGRKPAGDVENARQSVEIMQCIRERRLEYVLGK